MPSYRGISGRSNWEKTPGQTQNKLQGLYTISYLAWKHFGTPQKQLEGKDVGLVCCHNDLDQISSRKVGALKKGAYTLNNENCNAKYII